MPLLSRAHKPALFRRVLELSCAYPGQILSYNKMLGQLQDAGNTTTLAYYLDLLAGAGLVTGLTKYAATRIRQRASSPKLQVFNTALVTAQKNISLSKAREDSEFWGYLVELAFRYRHPDGLKVPGGADPAVISLGGYHWTLSWNSIICSGRLLLALSRRVASIPNARLPPVSSRRFAVNRRANL